MRQLNDDIIQQLKDKFLNENIEKCGVIIEKKNGWIQELRMFDNITDRNENVHYIADPQQLHDNLKETNMFSKQPTEDIICFVHNHPHGSSTPSHTDLTTAIWNLHYLIISKQNGQMVAQWFKVTGGDISEEMRT